jgi:hypothetical protein
VKPPHSWIRSPDILITLNIVVILDILIALIIFVIIRFIIRELIIFQ